MKTTFTDPAVARIFSDYSPPVRQRLLGLRELIFKTAKSIPGVGALEETLKWGQPGYLTPETKSGSTIRLDALRSKPDGYALYFHCQTDLVETFKQMYGKKFRYDGNRALLFSVSDVLPETEMRECIASALTYHLAKHKNRAPIGRLINQTRG